MFLVIPPTFSESVMALCSGLDKILAQNHSMLQTMQRSNSKPETSASYNWMMTYLGLDVLALIKAASVEILQGVCVVYL